MVEEFWRLLRVPFWPFYSVLLAAILSGGIVYAYMITFGRQDPSLKIEILSAESLVNPYVHIENLEIIHGGVNIKSTDKTLRNMVVKIENNSSSAILKGFFDENDPFGIKISKGEIIGYEKVGYSSEYIRDNISINLPSTNKITFSPIIFDPNSYIIISVLVLHEKYDFFRVEPTGKIAIVKEIEVKYPTYSSNRFWQVFEGDLQIQIMRLLGYFIGALIIILVTIASSLVIGGRFDTSKKARRIREIRKSREGSSITPSEEALFDLYTRGDGRLYIRDLLHLFESSHNFDNDFMVDRGQICIRPSLKMDSNAHHTFMELVTLEVVQKNGEEITIDYDAIERLRDMCPKLLKGWRGY
jgi:hypothetical protein